MKFSIVTLLGLVTVAIAAPQVIHEAAEVSAGLVADGIEPPTDFGPDEIDVSPATNVTDPDVVGTGFIGYGQYCRKAKYCNSRRCGWCANSGGWFKCCK